MASSVYERTRPRPPTIGFRSEERRVGKECSDVCSSVLGFLPGYLYDHQAVVTTMPLTELMERARVTPQAKAAGQSPDFSRLIRVGVPSPWDPAQ